MATVVLVAGCAIDSSDGDDEGKADGTNSGKLRPVTAAERLTYLANAELWHATDVPKMNLRQGQLGAVGYEANPATTLVCRFVEPTEDKPGGHSPKFLCERTEDKKVLKVKYSRDELPQNAKLSINGEVYAEAVSTRLFWALGFFADRQFASKVNCNNCPSGDPFSVYSGSDSSRVPVREFRNTLMEDKLPGKKIEECVKRDSHDSTKCLQTKEDQGWTWDELVANSRAPKEQVDALRLLAAFVYHADNKAANQRLLCVEIASDGSCKQSLAMVQDLGTTFGERTAFSFSKADLDAWRQQPVWKNAAKCQANLSIHSLTLGGDLEDPIVSEAGRKFLADLLVQLTDAQIEDLFRGARIDVKDPAVTDPAAREALIAGWVAAFKDKRRQLVDNKCP